MHYFPRALGCIALLVLLCAGCDNAQQLLDDAKKKADELAVSPPATPADAAESSDSPASESSASSSTAKEPTTPVPMPTPSAPPSDENLIAAWKALPTAQRGDAALQQLLVASPESLKDVTEFDFTGSRTALTLEGFRLLQKFPLVKTVVLSFHGMSAEKLAALSELPELEALLLEGSELSDAMLPSLSKLSTLRHLDVSKTSVTDAGLMAIHDLTEVQRLNLNDTAVNGSALVKARYLGALRHLEADRSPFSTNGFLALKSAPNLEFLSVNKTGTNDQHLKYLSGHNQLKTVRLYGTGITDLGLSFLNGNPLEEVDIRGDKITGAGLRFLRSAKKLRLLKTQETLVDEATRVALRKALPECMIE